MSSGARRVAGLVFSAMVSQVVIAHRAAGVQRHLTPQQSVTAISQFSFQNSLRKVEVCATNRQWSLPKIPCY